MTNQTSESSIARKIGPESVVANLAQISIKDYDGASRSPKDENGSAINGFEDVTTEILEFSERVQRACGGEKTGSKECRVYCKLLRVAEMAREGMCRKNGWRELCLCPCDMEPHKLTVNVEKTRQCG